MKLENLHIANSNSRHRRELRRTRAFALIDPKVVLTDEDLYIGLSNVHKQASNALYKASNEKTRLRRTKTFAKIEPGAVLRNDELYLARRRKAIHQKAASARRARPLSRQPTEIVEEPDAMEVC